MDFQFRMIPRYSEAPELLLDYMRFWDRGDRTLAVLARRPRVEARQAPILMHVPASDHR